MINQMQHAAATANMYASAGMYDPVTLNPYANGTFYLHKSERLGSFKYGYIL